MKIGSAVLGAHIAVVVALSLTQGCLTADTDNPGRGARHKGPFQHVHSGKDAVAVTTMQPVDMEFGTDMDNEPIYEPIDIGVTPMEPTPTALPPAVATETYIVRKGDTISQLAVDFDTTTANLVSLNNLANPDVLYVGQELRVPAGRRGTSPGATGSPSSSTVRKGGTYVIQKGDTLSEIALAAGVGIDALRELNNINGDMIMAGETLDIPAGGTVPPTRTQSSSPQSTSTPAETPAEDTAVGELDIPGVAEVGEDTSAPEGTAPIAYDAVEERIYYPGESLDDIAREYGVSKAEIMRLNGITDESQIRDGQRLRIPIAE